MPKSAWTEKDQIDNFLKERSQNQRDLPKDIPLDSVVVLRYEKRSKSKNKGKVPTEMELVLEQTQQGTSYEVSVSAEGVEELKRKVKIKGEKKEALLTLRQKPALSMCHKTTLASDTSIDFQIDFPIQSVDPHGFEGYLKIEVKEISHNDLVQDEVNSVLIAIIQGMNVDEQSSMRLEATITLFNTFEFAQTNFENEMERYYIMKVVYEIAMAKESEIRQSAFECPVSIASTYYDVLEPSICDEEIELQDFESGESGDSTLINVSLRMLYHFRDAIVSLVMAFVQGNITKSDWRSREAARYAFGSILEGPSVQKLSPMVTSAMDFMLNAMKDENNHVIDTTAWTLGRIFELLHSPATGFLVVSLSNFQRVMVVLLESIKDSPYVAEKVFRAIYFLAQGYKGFEAGSSVLTPFIADIVTSLIVTPKRPDAGVPFPFLCFECSNLVIRLLDVYNAAKDDDSKCWLACCCITRGGGKRVDGAGEIRGGWLNLGVGVLVHQWCWLGRDGTVGCSVVQGSVVNFDGKGGAIVDALTYMVKLSHIHKQEVENQGCRLRLEPKTIQKLVQIAGTLTNEALRNGSIKKKPEKRGNGGEPSKDRNVRDDNKRTRTCMAVLLQPQPCKERLKSLEETLKLSVAVSLGSGSVSNKETGKSADYSSVSTTFIPLLGIEPSDLGFSYEIEIASEQLVEIDKVIKGCKLEIDGHVFDINLIPFGSGSFDVIIGMYSLSDHKAKIICHEKVVRIPLLDGEVLRVLGEKLKEKMR
ncbi:importin subunit beta-1 [Tanacetum coccineum]